VRNPPNFDHGTNGGWWLFDDLWHSLAPRAIAMIIPSPEFHAFHAFHALNLALNIPLQKQALLERTMTEGP